MKVTTIAVALGLSAAVSACTPSEVERFCAVAKIAYEAVVEGERGGAAERRSVEDLASWCARRGYDFRKTNS